MFSQRKKFYEKRSFYIGLIVILAAFGIWINQTPADAVDDDELLISQTETDTTKQLDEEKNAGSPSSLNGIQTNKRVSSMTDEESLSEQNATRPPTVNDETTVRDRADDDDQEDEPPIGGQTRKTASYPYYLVQEVDGQVLVYHLDKQGQETLVRTTDISFALLSETDQQLFKEGIVLETEADILDLLQDFES